MLEPYLFFGGRCEEALNFYRDALGAKIEAIMRYREAPEQPPPGTLAPNWDNKVMHSRMNIAGTGVMASDGMGPGETGLRGASLALSLDSDAAVERAFNALAQGGQVQMPLGKTFFASRFGMVADKFGVPWMLISGAQQQ